MKTNHTLSPTGDTKVNETTALSRAPNSPRGLYYALDVNPRVLFELRRSIASVRKHAPELPIYAVIAGQPPEDDRRFLDSLGVTVIGCSIERGTSPIFMKWRALAELPPLRELLYLDTDTLVFDDPMRLFDLSGRQDFHARLEIGCDREPSAYPFLVNVMLLTKSHVDHWIYERIVRRLGVRFVPVFNTGIMLFRNGFAQRLGRRWNDFVRIERQFRRKRLPYPCWNAHLLEELVAPLVLGGLDEFTWGTLTPEQCPFYVEYRGRNVQSHGIVLHTWTPFYGSCIFEFIGKDDALAYQALRALDPAGDLVSGFRAKMNARSLLLGSMWMRLPKRFLEAWLQTGSTGGHRS